MATDRFIALIGAGLAVASLAACGDPGGAGLFGNAGAGGSGGSNGDGGSEGSTRSAGPGGPTGTGAGGPGTGAGGPGTGTGSPTSTTTTVGPASSVSSASGGCVSGAEYTCLTGQCIPATWQCDGLADCSDGSDEPPLNLACGSVVSSSASTGGCEASCPDGSGCLFFTDICDGQDDCDDESDERGCFEGEWRCNQTFYGAGDGCDCGCGTRDPDCTTPSASACDYCGGEGACTETCEQIREDQNWRCNGGG